MTGLCKANGADNANPNTRMSCHLFRGLMATPECKKATKKQTPLGYPCWLLACVALSHSGIMWKSVLRPK